MTELTTEQKERLERSKQQLIDEVLRTADVPQDYPLKADGSRDFAADLISEPLSREEVTYLVDLYYDMRLTGTGHDDAARLTYGCCYSQVDQVFSPRNRIAELRARNK